MVLLQAIAAAAPAQDDPPAAPLPPTEIHDLLAVEVEEQGLRLRSSGRIRSIGAIPDAEGRIVILLANHRCDSLDPIRSFAGGSVASLEIEGGGDGDAVLTRIVVTPRRPSSFQLQTAGDSAWLRWTGSPEAPGAVGDSEPPADATAASTPPARRSLRVLEGLNVRGGPGTEFPRIDRLGPGQRVEELDRDGDWVRIRFATGQGWIHGDYVETVAEPARVP